MYYAFGKGAALAHSCWQRTARWCPSIRLKESRLHRHGYEYHGGAEIKLASHFKWVQYRGMRSHFALQILISLAYGSMLFIKVCTRRRT
jgi:hypothetical protein